jgi:hypothetical protein
MSAAGSSVAERCDGEERPELADDFPPELPGFPAHDVGHLRPLRQIP